MGSLAETYQLLNLLPDPMQIVDLGGQIVFANRRMRQLFGDVCGGTCFRTIKACGTECDNCPRHRALTCFADRQMEIDTRIGRRMLVSHSTIAFQGQAYILECYKDVTEYVRTVKAEARVRAEVEMAGRLQGRCMTLQLDGAPLTYAYRYLPARTAAGDFLNAHVLPDGRTVLTIADVCGHGLGAAAITFMLKIAYDQLLADGLPMERFPSELNKRLYRYLLPDRFLTLAMVCIDPVGRTCQFVNAGHPPVMHMRSDGQTDLLQARIPPVGIVENLEACSYAEIPLNPNDRLLLYSDGLFQEFDRSFDLFAQRARSLSCQPLAALLQGLLPSAAAAVEDDVTVLAVQMTPPASTGA